MKDFKDEKTHESYGMLSISKCTGRFEFFGSDLVHNNAVSISICKGSKKRGLSNEWFHANKEIIQINMSNSQFVDAITSGMNTQGVPCTIRRLNNKPVPQISHIEDKKEIFKNEMSEQQEAYKQRIDDIVAMLEGNIGKRKKEDIKHELDILKSHISSNTNFIMEQFEESMEKVVTEAKHSVASYIDNKVTSLGIEAMRDELSISIEKE